MERIRVVLVDDHPVVREGISRLLERDERILVVGEAANAEDAVAQAGTASPQVVLMDVRMPGLDGIKAVQLTSGPENKAKIILMSGYADQIKRVSEEELNVFAVIDKPLALRVLIRFVQAALHDND